MQRQTEGGGGTYTQQSGQKLKDATRAFELNRRAFVYGTLKEGYSNNRLLMSSRKMTNTQTVSKLVLGNVGFPYAFPDDAVPEQYKKLLFPVKGEMYEVDTVKSFVNLDILEGYPSHYNRRIVRFENGLDAWMYVQPDWYNARYCDACTLEDETWSWP